MSDHDCVRLFLVAALTAHKKHCPTEKFDLVSLLEQLGLNGTDWSNHPLGLLYRHYEDEYLERGLASKKASADANKTAAHRGGAMLRSALRNEFADQFEVLGKKGTGRYGGRTEYRWKGAKAIA